MGIDEQIYDITQIRLFRVIGCHAILRQLYVIYANAPFRHHNFLSCPYIANACKEATV